MLESQMKANLYSRQGHALTNFNLKLPVTQSSLAQEILKDPYNFEFLSIEKGYEEKELEDALVANVTRFQSLLAKSTFIFLLLMNFCVVKEIMKL